MSTTKQNIEQAARMFGVDATELARATVEKVATDDAYAAWARLCDLAGDDEPETIDNSLGAQWSRRST